MMGKILGGWNLSGIMRAYSGNPVTPSASRSALNRCVNPSGCAVGTTGFVPFNGLTANGGTSTCTSAQSTNIPGTSQPGCITNTVTYVAGSSVSLAPGVTKIKIKPGSRTEYFNTADFIWPASAVVPSAQNCATPPCPSNTPVGVNPFYANYPGAGLNGAPGGIIAMGNLGRNTVTVPGFLNFDFTLRKDTAMPFLGEGGKMEFRFELFNAANHPRLGTPTTAVFNNQGVLSATAGTITDARGNSRQIQLSLRMVF